MQEKQGKSGLATTDLDQRDRKGRQAAAYAAAVALGAALRMLHPGDFLWQGDQRWTFARALETGHSIPWSWLGMTSSAGVPNPGFGVWIFVVIARCLHVTTAVALSQSVAMLNVLALALLGAWVMKQVPAGEREGWLWAGALASVNPLAVFLGRVIWPVCLAPLVMVAFWIGFWNRRRWGGALLWGAVGACLGQLHPAGVFVVVAMVLSALIARDRREVRWGSFLGGAALLGWPMIPWAATVLSTHYERTQWTWSQHFPGKVWIWWLLSDSGLATKFLTANFWATPFMAFLRFPSIGGHATYGVFFLHLALTVVTGFPVAAWLWRRWRGDPSKAAGAPASESTLIQKGMLFWFAGLLTLLPSPVFVHYFLVTFPIGYLCIARLWLHSNLRWSRQALCVILALQCALSLASSIYVHRERPPLPGTIGIPPPTPIQDGAQ